VRVNKRKQIKRLKVSNPSLNPNRQSAILCPIGAVLLLRCRPIRRLARCPRPVQLPVSRHQGFLVVGIVGTGLRSTFLFRAHVLVEFIDLVHLIHFLLLGIQPTLQEFGVILNEN
jgi:hypothetical protein